MYGMSAQILKERQQYQELPELAFGSMRAFGSSFAGGEVRLDDAYQAILPEFHRRRDALEQSDLPGAFRLLYA
jgi:enoyl-[acyl-carrier protein] reductase/trans-2-enoyl-CoA reductase (NAD+)